MTSRGPLRQPGSVRDLRTGGEATTHDAPMRPVPPCKLKAEVRRVFDRLCDEMLAANVPCKPGDGGMVAMTAQCEVDYYDARDSKERARIGRDLEKNYAQLGLHPASRMRLGVKLGTTKQGTAAKLLALARPAAAPNPGSDGAAG